MIREATHDDVPVMLALGAEMHAESRYARHPWNDAKVLALLHRLVDDPDGLALLALDDDRPVGGFIGEAFDHWCTDARQSFDYALFVLPEYRGGLTGARLLRQYARWAQGRSVPRDLIGCGITTGVDMAASTHLFGLCGFEHVGNLFVLSGVK